MSISDTDQTNQNYYRAGDSFRDLWNKFNSRAPRTPGRGYDDPLNRAIRAMYDGNFTAGEAIAILFSGSYNDYSEEALAEARTVYHDTEGQFFEVMSELLGVGEDVLRDQLLQHNAQADISRALEDNNSYAEAAIISAGNAFSDLGYDASNAERLQFANNPDDIADYVNPRQVTAQEAAEIFQRTYGYEPNKEEIEQFMGQGGEGFEASQQEAIGEYVDPRHVSLEELEAIAEEQGYDLTPEDYENLIGQAEGEGYAGWGVVLNEDGTIKDYGMQGNVISQDFDRAVVKDEDELREIASNPDVGFDISDLSEEEIADLIGGMSEQEVADQLDPLGVSTKELGDIARQENFDLANLSKEELAQLVGNNQESDIIQDIDSRATTVGELQEVYKQRTGNELSAEEAQDMLDKAVEANDGTLTEEQFEEWVDETIETNFKVQLQNLGQNILDIIFGKDPATGASKTIQQIWEEQRELLFPPSPSDPDYERKYTEWLKRQSGSIISVNHDPKEGIFAGVRFPVPIPVSGPEVIIPLFDEDGKYIGGNPAQVLLNEVGDLVTETGERIGQMTGNVIQIFDAAGEVVHAIPISEGGIDPATGLPVFVPAGWEEGGANPWEVQDSNGDGVIDQQVDADGNPVDPDTGLPIQKEPEEEPPPDRDGDGIPDVDDLYPDDPTNTPPDADAIEEGAYEGMGNDDVDGDGIPNDQDEFPNDPNNGVDPDASDDGATDEGTTDEGTTDEGTTDTDEGPEFPDDYATQQDVFDAKQEVLAEIGNPEDGTGLWGELNALGLENDEITALLGNPSGVDEDGNPIEAQGLYALVEGAATTDDLFGENGVVSQIEGLIGTPNYAEDGTTIIGGTGLFGLYDETRDIKDILGEPQYDEEGNLTSDSTGIFSDLYNQQQTITNLNDLSPEQVRDIVDAALKDYDFENLTQTEVEDIVADALEEYGFENLSEQDVKDIVGEPERDDEGNLTGGTGIYGDLYAQQQDITNLTTLVSNLNNLSTSDVRTVVENILTEQGLDSLNDLSEEQVEAIVDRIVGSPATDDEDASGLYALVGNLNDLSEDDVTRIVTTALGDLEDLSKEDVTGIVNDIVGTPATDDEDASGLFALLEGQQAQISEVTDLVGEPTLNEDGEIVGGTGLYGELYAAGLRDDEILNLIGTPDNPETDENEASGLYLAYQQGTDATQNYIDTNVLPEITSISDRLGTPDDPDTEEDEATGIYAEIDALVEQGASEYDALSTAVGNLSEQLGITETEILDAISDSESRLSDQIGTPAVADDPDTEEDESQPATGIYADIAAAQTTITGDISALTDLVMAYEAEGLSRDEALATAISDLSDQLGTTEETFLASLGETEETVLDAIAASEATITGDISALTDLVMAYEADGIDRDEALTLAVNDLSEDLGLTRDELLLQIGESETTIMDAIDASQMETDQYLDYISSVIGRPASELTQDDIDIVVDLLAEDEAISDFNNDMRLYDVNFDGQIDQTDIGLLQGFVDAGVEGVGEIPATGIYADAARRQEEITGSIADQAAETQELIGTEAEATRGLMSQQNLFNALMGAGDVSGIQVTEKAPDPVQLQYIYDFSDIFATPQQRGLFPSPYGAPQRQAAQQISQQRGIMSGPLNLGGLQGRPGMAAGGKVDYDFTDEIMHIMKYGDS